MLGGLEIMLGGIDSSRPFGDHYWPGGDRRFVDSFVIDGDRWDLYEQVYSSGGCFSNVEYLLICIRHIENLGKNTVWDFKRVHLSMVFPYELQKEYDEKRGIPLISEIQRKIHKKYHGGILTGDSR